MPLEYVVAGVMGLALVIYSLTGGADFGGGVWDLCARGPRAARQRALIEHAIAPIWEANHVWLIVAVVLMFVAFPKAFAVIAIALHIPLTAVLVGIVLRGSAFTFRAYGLENAREQRFWTRLFAISSTLTPLGLGVCVGAIASGGIRVDPTTHLVTSGYVDSWLAPFPLAIGGFTLAIFAFLAAVYLAASAATAQDHELADDFRLRALIAAGAVGVLAWISFLAADREGVIFHGLLTARWSIAFQLLTGGVSLGAIALLVARRFAAARLAAGAQVVLILLGWMLAQSPHVVVPDLLFTDPAVKAPDSVLRPLLIVLVLGLLLIIPSFLYLYSIFAARRTDDKADDGSPGGDPHHDPTDAP